AGDGHRGRARPVLCIRDRPRRRPVCALDLPPGAQRGRHTRDGSVGCGTTPADAAELDPGPTGRAGAPHRRHADQDPGRPQKDGGGLSVRAHARGLPCRGRAGQFPPRLVPSPEGETAPLAMGVLFCPPEVRGPSQAPHPAGDGRIASCLSPWYAEPMDRTPFDLTPDQRGMLASLSRETGKPIPALIAKALETLQEREHGDHVHGEPNGSEQTPGVSPPPPTPTHIWEMAQERFGDLSEAD